MLDYAISYMQVLQLLKYLILWYIDILALLDWYRQEHKRRLYALGIGKLYMLLFGMAACTVHQIQLSKSWYKPQTLWKKPATRIV